MSKRKIINTEWVYGIHTIDSLLTHNPESVLSIKIQDDTSNHSLQSINAKITALSIPCEISTRQQLSKLTSGATHQGVVAQIKSLPVYTERYLSQLSSITQDFLLLILDGIQDPHNLGACLRTANAANVDAVIIPKNKATGLTPVARKVASGAAELTPLIQVSNLGRTLRSLKESGVWLIGTNDKAEQSLYSIDFNRPTGIILGAEGSGIRHLTETLCDEVVNIPMLGQVPSLNVSVAAGICMYEIQRSRGNFKI